MTDIKSNDYHDFVIKDGKLIGEFEQMYEKSDSIPWHQDEQDDWLDVRLALELLKEYAEEKPDTTLGFDTIVDFGCGLGYFLDILEYYVGSYPCNTIGYDVSATCCEKARKIFPNTTFNVLDLMQDKAGPIDNIQSTKKLFSIRGTLWYVFPEMQNVVNNISNMTTKGDYLLVSQNFPPLDSQFVGKDVIPNPDSIIKWFDKFTPLKTIFLEDKVSKDNSNWFVGVFARK